MLINANWESLFSKFTPEHFVLYSLLDSEPAHEHYWRIFVISLNEVNCNLSSVLLVS